MTRVVGRHVGGGCHALGGCAQWGDTPEQSPMAAQSLCVAHVETHSVWEPDVLLELLQ